MKITLACLCDHASSDSVGKLAISGIFDRLHAHSVPIQHPRMYLVFRMQFEHEDGGTVHDVRIRILDEDANQLTEVKGKISAPEAIAPGGFRTQNTIFELNGFVFPKFGRYVFELKADDESVVEVSLEVAAA